MKHTANQFELPGAEVAFNLAIETTIDGERLARDRSQSERDRQAAERNQPNLVQTPAPSRP